jgi:CubicO group peptidase (beta-lactamase class C family)
VDTAKIDKHMLERIEADKFPSLSIGVVHDQQLLYAKAYGVADRETGRPATPDTIYRIGSVTKVFTTTLMCMLRDKGLIRLDDPVGKYLPEDVQLPSDPRGEPVITLRHLATHSSGLPRLTPNVAAKGEDAYGGYTVEQLYEGLAEISLIYPTGAKSVYSNLGVGLLGHVLERAAGQPYETLLKKHLLEPLAMKDTTITLSASQRERFALPYNGEGFAHETADWDFGRLAPCGGLASTVPNLAKFLSLLMRAGQAGLTPICGGTLTELQTPQRLTDGWKNAVGLGWQIAPAEDLGDFVWHDGGTGGHFSFVGFLTRKKIGVIVLGNASKEVNRLGSWLLKTVLEATEHSGPATQPVPKAEEILDRYIEVTGGAKAHAAVHTVVTRSKGTFAGIPIACEEYQAVPGKYHITLNMGGLGTSYYGSDGQTVWEMETGDTKIVTGRQRDADLRDNNPARDLRWRDYYEHVECKGIVDFDDRKCYNVHLTPADGLPEDRFYDCQTFLLIGRKITIEDDTFGMVPIEEVYGDYTRYGGILLPATRGMKVAGMEMVLKVQSLEINAEIPDSRFELPPAVKELLDKAAATQADKIQTE